MRQQYLEAGKLVTTHGVRGELKLDVWCDSTARLRGVKTLYGTAGGEKPLTVASLRGSETQAIVRFAGVDSVEQARALVGRVLYVDRADMTLPEGVYYIADLLGCEVRDADTGRVYGTVKSITHPGPQDIYTVLCPDGKERMFPGVPAFLRDRQPEQGYILVSPIAGMLDDDALEDKPPRQEED